MSPYIEGFLTGAAIAGAIFGFLVAHRGGFRDTQLMSLKLHDPKELLASLKQAARVLSLCSECFGGDMHYSSCLSGKGERQRT